MKQTTLFLLLLFSCLPVPANAKAEGEVHLGVGSEYTSGKYGSEDKTEIWSFPITGRYTSGPWLLKAVIPYLHLTGPGNTIAMNNPLAGETARRTASGLGDIIAGLSYALYENPASGVMFDLGCNIKFGTADKSQGLGTGRNDYAISGELSKQIGKWGMFTGLGWKIMGSAPDYPLHNTWYGSTGLSYKIFDQTIGGLIYDYRGEVAEGGSKLNEITVFISQGISPSAKIQGYLLKGFSNASPDMGGGITLSLQFY